MHPFIDVLVVAAEKPIAEGRSLADMLRDSFNPEWKSYDAALVDELVTVIKGVVNGTPAEELRAAYNFLVEQHDADPLEEGEELGGPYADIFIDGVLTAIRDR
jgi:hypothetical protein